MEGSISFNALMPLGASPNVAPRGGNVAFLSMRVTLFKILDSASVAKSPEGPAPIIIALFGDGI